MPVLKSIIVRRSCAKLSRAMGMPRKRPAISSMIWRLHWFWWWYRRLDFDLEVIEDYGNLHPLTRCFAWFPVKSYSAGYILRKRGHLSRATRFPVLY